MTHFDRHAFIFDENVQIRSLHEYVSKKKGQQVRLVPKPIREITLVPGVNQRKIPKFKKPLEQRHIVLKIDPSRLTGEGEEKSEVKEKKKEEVKEEKSEVKEEKKEAMEVEKEKELEKNETMEIEKSEEKEAEKNETMEAEKRESADTEKPQAQEIMPIKEDNSTLTTETKKEETTTPTNTQSTPTNSTDNDLLTDHRDMYFAD